MPDLNAWVLRTFGDINSIEQAPFLAAIMPDLNAWVLRTFGDINSIDPVIHHEKETNYLEPPLKNLEDAFDQISFNPDNIYFKAHMTILKTFIEHSHKTKDYFAICPFSHFDPLDLANQFRGNDLMFDFYDENNADRLHDLLERCTRSILDMENHIRQNHLNDCLFPERAVGGCLLSGGTYLSCDIGDMISPEMLKTYLPYTNKIINQWGGAFLHHHELGIHQIPTWSESPNLCLQFLNRDPNTRHLAQTIDDTILEHSLKTPLFFIATPEEFKENAHLWSQGKFIISINCNSLHEAEEIIATRP